MGKYLGWELDRSKQIAAKNAAKFALEKSNRIQNETLHTGILKLCLFT